MNQNPQSQTLQVSQAQERIKFLLLEEKDRLLVEDPEWQRNRGIWDTEMKSRLIESILLGLPVPPLFFLASGQKREIVDGLQRFTTVKDFTGNKFPLTSLEFLGPTLGGMRFRDLPQEEQDKILLATFSTYTAPSNTTWGRDVARVMFARLNAGVPVSPQEVRTGLNESVLTKEVSQMIMDIIWVGDQYKTRRRSKMKRMSAEEDALILLTGLETTLDDEDILLGGYQFKNGRNKQWTRFLNHQAAVLGRLDMTGRTDQRKKAEEMIRALSCIFSVPFTKWQGDDYSPRTNKPAVLLQTWGFNQTGLPLSHWSTRAQAVEGAWKEFCGTARLVGERCALMNDMHTWKAHLAAIP